MLTVTENACEFAGQMLAEESTREGTCVRIDLNKEGRGHILMAQEQPEDSKYEHEGKTVLLVSKQAGEQFTGRTLDAERTEEGAKMVLK